MQAVQAVKTIKTAAAQVSNADDDTAAMQLTQHGTTTNEKGTVVVTFSFKLLTEPQAVVAFPCAVNPRATIALSGTSKIAFPITKVTPPLSLICTATTTT